MMDLYLCQMSRKYGTMNKNDGLLLFLSLITDKIERYVLNWKIEE